MRKRYGIGKSGIIALAAIVAAAAGLAAVLTLVPGFKSQVTSTFDNLIAQWLIG